MTNNGELTISTYFANFDNYKNLSNEELYDLLGKARDGDTKARDKIVYSFQKYIYSTAKKWGMLNDAMADSVKLDIIIAGNVGLTEAISKYDVKRGKTFMACAEFYIRNSLYENARKSCSVVYMPKNVYDDLNRVKKAMAECSDDAQLQDKIQYTANKLGISEEEVKENLSRDYKVTSLTHRSDDDSDDEQDSSDQYAFDNSVSAEEGAIFDDTCRAVHKSLGCLNAKQRAVVTMYFGLDGGEPLTYSEIGEQLGLTKQRAQQILKEAQAKLHESRYLDGLCA